MLSISFYGATYYKMTNQLLMYMCMFQTDAHLFFCFFPCSCPPRRDRVSPRAKRSKQSGQTLKRSLISQWLFFTIFFFFHIVTLHLPLWQQPSLFRNSQPCLFFWAEQQILQLTKYFALALLDLRFQRSWDKGQGVETPGYAMIQILENKSEKNISTNMISHCCSSSPT